MDKEKRNKNNNYILYNFDGIIYYISDVEAILAQCKAVIDEHKNDLKWLYNKFGLQTDHGTCKRDCVTEVIADKIALIFQIDDKSCIETEVRNCRRRIYYWENVEPLLYFANENIGSCKKTNRHQVSRRKLERKDFDELLTAACNLVILQSSNSKEQINSDKKWLHKNDYDYVKAIKYFQDFVMADVDTMNKPDMTVLCNQLEERIRCFGIENFYKQLVKSFANVYSDTEGRILLDDKAGICYPTLYHFTIKLLTEKNSGFNQRQTRVRIDEQTKITNSKEKVLISEVAFEDILDFAKNLVILLEKNNEMNIGFIVKNVDGNYLQDLVAYSAVYDLHQCNYDGVLFLVERIIKAYGDVLQKKLNLPYNVITAIIKCIVTRAQTDFKHGLLTKINLAELQYNELIVLDKLSESKPLNEGYILPTDWDKVTDDSVWVIKKDEMFYILPPVLSAWGIYDSVNALLGWPSNMGYVFEEAIHDLFRQINKEVFYGKFALKDVHSLLLSGENINDRKIAQTKLYESDGLVLDSDYAIATECKRKPLTRKARGGKQKDIIKDLVESYINGQVQACRLERAIRTAQETSNGILDFFTDENAGAGLKSTVHGKCKGSIISVDCTGVKTILRLTCTPGNYWILSETGIIGKLEGYLKNTSESNRNKYRYLKDFTNELNAIYEITARIQSKENVTMNMNLTKKIVGMNHLFISFDKLYDLSKKLNGFPIGKALWTFTRIQVKNNTTMNFIKFLINCSK